MEVRNVSVVEKEFVITLEQGLHARPAAQFVQTANRFTAEITVTAGAERASARSIFGILRLGARQGTRVTIRAEGADAAAAVESLGRLLTGEDGQGG